MYLSLSFQTGTVCNVSTIDAVLLGRSKRFCRKALPDVRHNSSAKKRKAKEKKKIS
jgi:hypothetical protein